MLFLPLLCNASKKPSTAHYPVQNLQGIDFEADFAFVKSYQRHLITKSKERHRLNAIESATSQSAIKTYDIKNTDKLKVFEPKDTGWERNYIPPPKSKVAKVTGYMKQGVFNLFKDSNLHASVDLFDKKRQAKQSKTVGNKKSAVLKPKKSPIIGKKQVAKTANIKKSKQNNQIKAKEKKKIQATKVNNINFA